MSEKPNVVPFERDADFLRQRALKNQKDNHLIDALELMRKAVEAQPDNDEYRMELAQLLTEVGCPERSNREWLTLIYDPDNRGRCFYGMAMNQLAQGDTQTAQKLLNECIYHATGMEEAGRQLRDQIDLLEAMRIRPRRVRHIQTAVEKACLRLYAGDVGLARRSLRQILEKAPDQADARALLGLAEAMDGNLQEAVSQVEQALPQRDGDGRTLCVAAEVYHMAGADDKARELLIQETREMRPQDKWQMLTISTLFENGLYQRAWDWTKDALVTRPYDRALLHMMALLSLHLGQGAQAAAGYWHRIRRIDPEDTIAAYYLELAEQDRLGNWQDFNGDYQVPEAEKARRYAYLTELMDADVEQVVEKWKSDADFRALVDWCLNAGEVPYQKSAMMLLCSTDDPRAVCRVREYLMREDTDIAMRIRAVAMYRSMGLDPDSILPPYMKIKMLFAPDGDKILRKMGVGHTQLVHYAEEVLQREYDQEPGPMLALTWEFYRDMRKLRYDPLLDTETAAAMLAWNFLRRKKQNPQIEKLSRQFDCSPRRLRYFCKYFRKVMAGDDEV